MRVHIGHHFYGAGNFGDDIMLAGFLTALFDKDVKIHLTCCTPFDIESQRQSFSGNRVVTLYTRGETVSDKDK